MITLSPALDRLQFHFPEVDKRARCEIGFQRTLRLPDDGSTYPLPAGLGQFPLRHIDDYADRLPDSFVKRGGVIMPMWQAEAMWLHFSGGGTSWPCAVKIAAGKINAVTGEAWRPKPRQQPQDYLVVPRQPWLDGFCVEKGVIRQFVAAPLGEGITAEEQLSGEAEHGGIQIIVYPMTRTAYDRLFPPRPPSSYEYMPMAAACARGMPKSMGLAAGGLMRQEIYDDPYDFDVWEQSVSSRCFVTILNAAQWHALIGEAPPTQPTTAAEYKRHGIPWFDYYATDRKALKGSSLLAGLKSFAHSALAMKTGPDAPVVPTPVVDLGPNKRPVAAPVREAES
ncbi:MAG: hypothetical protein JO055_05455 [Alphaproteobacteria bacterium]|nr:hypothetical protein [Alphaproteobacteria bacterium]